MSVRAALGRVSNHPRGRFSPELLRIREFLTRNRIPHQWLDPDSGCAALDERGFVLTDRSLGEAHLGELWKALGRQPLPFETNYPGLFAVGDVRAGSIKRVAAAVGEGSSAVRSVHEYLAFTH